MTIRCYSAARAQEGLPSRPGTALQGSRVRNEDRGRDPSAIWGRFASGVNVFLGGGWSW